MQTAEIVLWVLAVYLAMGCVAGLAFVFVGVDRADSAARGTSLMFRLLILPGSVALWPLVTVRWVQSIKGSHP